MSKYTPFSLFIRQALLYPLISPFLPPASKVQKNYSYANGQQIGTLENTDFPEDQSFVDNGDGTISDLSTGLMWAKDGLGAGCYNGGLNKVSTLNNYANSLVFAGYDDWRMPTIRELFTMNNYLATFPSVFTAFFTNIFSENYWTSTTVVGAANYYYYVSFQFGAVGSAPNTGSARLWCVRKIT